MTYETVEQTINLLCEKLGIVVDSATGVAEQLVPELVRMQIWTNCFYVLIDLIVIVIILTLAIKYLKKFRSNNFDDVDDFVGCAVLVVAFIATPIFLCELFWDGTELIKWIVAPNIQVIEYITSLIG